MASGWHRKRVTPAEIERRAKYRSQTHRAARTHYTREIAAGRGICWRCRRPIPPATPGRAWHVGHDDHDTNLIRGAEHARCNLRAAAQAGARTSNQQREHTKHLPTW